MTTDTLFPVADMAALPTTFPRRTWRCQWTGERRSPKAGEWFLSGAVVEGYRAHADLETPYHIARLVEVERVERVVTP